MMSSPNRLGRTHFAGAVEDVVEPLLARQQAPELVLLLGEPPQAVLDDDDRAVDDEAEVERAQAHQVAADTCLRPCR